MSDEIKTGDLKSLTPPLTPPATVPSTESVSGKSSLNSAVTADLSNQPDSKTADPVEEPVAEETIAEEVAPVSELSDADEAYLKAQDSSFEVRAQDASIGLVIVDGIDLRYIGVAPAREKDAKTPGGFPITSENSRFTPLANVSFHPSVRIKDPKSGEFYYPADGITSYELCEYEGNPLVPRTVNAASSAARRQALIDARKR